jgi:hypothetical protein
MIKIIKRENRFMAYLGTIFLGSFLTEIDAREGIEDLFLSASYKGGMI